MKRYAVSMEFTIDFFVLAPDDMSEDEVAAIASDMASDTYTLRDMMDGDTWYVSVGKPSEATHRDAKHPDAFAVSDDREDFVDPDTVSWMGLDYEPEPKTDPDNDQQTNLF